MSNKHDLIFFLLSLFSLSFVFVFSLSVATRSVIILMFSFAGLIIWVIGLKKKRKVTTKGIIGFVVFLLDIFIAIYMVKSIIATDNYNYAQKLTEIKVPRTAQLLEKVEEHGGFLGYGESYMVFQLNDKELSQLKTKILKNANWNALPLKGIALQNSRYFTKEHYTNSKRMRDIPVDSTNGFYYFDGHIDGFSKNFTFSLLDAKSKTLYIFREDT